MSFLIHSTSKMMNSKKLFVTDWLVFFVAIIFFIFSRYHLWFSHISFNDISFFFFTQRSSFEHHWDKYMQVNMGFDEFEFVYPVVPEQPLDNKLVTIFSFFYYIRVSYYLTSICSLFFSLFLNDSQFDYKL